MGLTLASTPGSACARLPSTSSGVPLLVSCRGAMFLDGLLFKAYSSPGVDYCAPRDGAHERAACVCCWPAGGERWAERAAGLGQRRGTVAGWCRLCPSALGARVPAAFQLLCQAGRTPACRWRAQRILYVGGCAVLPGLVWALSTILLAACDAVCDKPTACSQYWILEPTEAGRLRPAASLISILACRRAPAARSPVSSRLFVAARSLPARPLFVQSR